MSMKMIQELQRRSKDNAFLYLKFRLFKWGTVGAGTDSCIPLRFNQSAIMMMQC